MGRQHLAFVVISRLTCPVALPLSMTDRRLSSYSSFCRCLLLPPSAPFCLSSPYNNQHDCCFNLTHTHTHQESNNSIKSFVLQRLYLLLPGLLPTLVKPPETHLSSSSSLSFILQLSNKHALVFSKDTNAWQAKITHTAKPNSNIRWGFYGQRHWKQWDSMGNASMA